MLNISHVRIATRRSPLALKQAELVKALLLRYFPTLAVEMVPIVTSGDKLLDHSLASAGGKGMFIKELEQAILAGEADIAVHSLKDIPADCAAGLEINTFLEREDPRDVFISPLYHHPAELPAGATIGTASLRRQAMIKHHYPTINIQLLRGNINTRLAKLDDKQYDGIILAAAGLHRLGFEKRIQYYFSPEESLPAIGQGVISIQSRHDKKLRKLLTQIDHYPTRLCVLAERAMNHALGGNCHAPIAGYATIQGERLHLRGRVYSPDGSVVISAETFGESKSAEQLGMHVAQLLLAKGASEILANIK